MQNESVDFCHFRYSGHSDLTEHKGRHANSVLSVDVNCSLFVAKSFTPPRAASSRSCSFIRSIFRRASGKVRLRASGNESHRLISDWRARPLSHGYIGVISADSAAECLLEKRSSTAKTSRPRAKRARDCDRTETSHSVRCTRS